RQVNVLNSLLSNARLGRLQEIEKFDAANAYPLAEFMGDVKRLIWNSPQATTPDANRRTLQRAYVTRLGTIVNPPPAPPAPTGGANAAPPPATPPPPPRPFLAPLVLSQSDLPALARAQLRTIQVQARTAAGTTTNAVLKAHWSDIADRVSEILEPKK